GTGQGDCDDGLECMTEGTASICVATCDPDVADSCGTGRVCLELQAGGGICFDEVGSHESCFADAMCGEDGQVCMPIAINLATDPQADVSFMCVTTCTAVSTGVGECGAGQHCV